MAAIVAVVAVAASKYVARDIRASSAMRADSSTFEGWHITRRETQKLLRPARSGAREQLLQVLTNMVNEAKSPLHLYVWPL